RREWRSSRYPAARAPEPNARRKQCRRPATPPAPLQTTNIQSSAEARARPLAPGPPAWATMAAEYPGSLRLPATCPFGPHPRAKAGRTGEELSDKKHLPGPAATNAPVEVTCPQSLIQLLPSNVRYF